MWDKSCNFKSPIFFKAAIADLYVTMSVDRSAGHPKILFGLRPKSLPKTGSLSIIDPVTCITLTKVKNKIVQLCILVLDTTEGE